MKNNENLKNTYNKIARDWSNDHAGDDWWVEGTDAFLSLLPKGAKVLDIGCGSGYKTKYIKEKGFDVKGIDFSEKMIQISKERFSDINFEVVDLYDFDKFDKTFDGIFCQAVLLHIPKKDILDILGKMKSKLNKNGLLYIAVKEVKEDKLEERIKKENDYGYEYEVFFSFFTMDELKKYFSKLELEVIYEEFIRSGRANWINIIGKK
jgi:2-polyprenyl-3-methyl-5-hydroxy-6-metoxy-1,4-benzoquinol methylase